MVTHELLLFVAGEGDMLPEYLVAQTNIKREFDQGNRIVCNIIEELFGPLCHRGYCTKRGRGRNLDFSAFVIFVRPLITHNYSYLSEFRTVQKS